MILVIVSNIFYHISQKSIVEELNPVVSMVATYLAALVMTLILFVIFPLDKNSLSAQLSSINWANYVLGFSLVGLELGFLLAYRSGWNISFAAIFANVAVTILLIPIGIYFFKDKINFSNAIGIVLSIIGLYLINKK
jgi:uncharacterized membrane protein